MKAQTDTENNTRRKRSQGEKTKTATCQKVEEGEIRCTLQRTWPRRAQGQQARSLELG